MSGAATIAVSPARPEPLAPAAQPVPHVPQVPPAPSLRAVLRHVGLSLLWANVVPAVLFYACLVTGGVWVALVAALVWCYAVMGWRVLTGRRASGLLMLTALGLTAKTVLAFASGSTFLYFVQPVVSDGLVAVAFLASLATARPVVSRLARDFYPLTDDHLARPRVRRLFWRLTLLWALVCLGRAVVTLWLLESLPLATFVALKSVLILIAAGLAVAATVLAAVRVARSEGLLPQVRAAHA